MIRTRSLIIALVASFSFIAAAQYQPDENDRRKWINEVRNYKHDFLAKDLDLSKEQQQEFFASYDEMEDRISQLNTETRELEQKVSSNPEATEVEIEAAARASYSLKNEESKIELEYFDKFKEILSPRQLIKLKNAERKFAQQLMIHHRRLKRAEGEHRKQ